jgi:hypothetical protein
MRPVLALLALLFASPALAISQDIHPGDGTIDGKRVQPYENAWSVRIRYSDGRVVSRGLSSDHVSLHTSNGRRFLTRIESTTVTAGSDAALPRGGASSTFNVFDPTTLLPAYSEAHGLAGDIVRQTFRGDGVDTVSRDASGAETTTRVPMSEPAYDFDGGMTGLILAAMPLREAFSASVPSLGMHGVVMRHIEVVCRERVNAGRFGRVETWVVRVGAQDEGTLYWIAPNAPYVIRCEITRSDGSVVIWAML